MASSLLSHVASDLCIGRPRVLTLPSSTPVVAVLAALRTGAGPFVFVDATEPASRAKKTVAVTTYVKISVADILCYVCGDAGNLRDPAAAVARPVSSVVGGHGGLARRIDPQKSLLDAIDALLIDGCQDLLVPLHARARKRQQHHHVPSSDAIAADCCVLTREDIVRHLFGSISHFSPVAALTVVSLGLVRRDVHAVPVDADALDAVPLLRSAVADGTAVAIVDDEDNALLGEICPGVLASCDVESVCAAFAALSVGDFVTYVDYSLSHYTPPEFLLRAVRAQLRDRGLDAMAELMDTWEAAASLPLSPSLSTSSDEDSPLGRARRPRRLSSGSFGFRSTEDVVACHSGSSLVAVMAQALAHRVGHVWVVDEPSGALVGVVRFADVLAVLREHIRPQVLLE